MPAYRNKTGANRGKRFHGKGWREPGCGSLYFQLKREHRSRYHAVSPDTTMDELIDGLLSNWTFCLPIQVRTVSHITFEHLLTTPCPDDVQEEYEELENGLEFVYYFHKKMLERSEEPAFDTFDGGERVYIKVMDEDGLEYTKPWFGGSWTVKVRGKQPRA